MGLISGALALRAISKIRNGRIGKLSIAQITQMIVNLPDARANLEREVFEGVYELYKGLQLCSVKTPMTMSEYISVATGIVRMFNSQASYEKFSGGDPAETMLMLEEIRQSDELESRDFQRFAERVQTEIEQAQRKRKVRKIVCRVVFALLFCFFVWKLFNYLANIAASQGFEAGYDSGYSEGYEKGNTVGSVAASDKAYQNGFTAGYTSGALDEQVKIFKETVYCDNSNYHRLPDCPKLTTTGVKKKRVDAIDGGQVMCYACFESNGYLLGLEEGYEGGFDEGLKAAIDTCVEFYKKNGYLPTE